MIKSDWFNGDNECGDLLKYADSMIFDVRTKRLETLLEFYMAIRDDYLIDLYDQATGFNHEQNMALGIFADCINGMIKNLSWLIDNRKGVLDGVITVTEYREREKRCLEELAYIHAPLKPFDCDLFEYWAKDLYEDMSDKIFEFMDRLGKTLKFMDEKFWKGVWE